MRPNVRALGVSSGFAEPGAALSDRIVVCSGGHSRTPYAADRFVSAPQSRNRGCVDQVRVLCNTARKGEVGTIIDLVPVMTFDGHSESYLVRFDTPTGPVSEHYPHYDLYIPLRRVGADRE